MRRKLETTRLEISLPLPLRAQMDMRLFSELEGRVPHGAYSKFIEELIRDHFRKEQECSPANS